MKKEFTRCSECGKKLLVRKGHLYHFAFGRILDARGNPVTTTNSDGREHPVPAVEMLIQGAVAMRCISKECRRENPDHWNAIHQFEDIEIL